MECPSVFLSECWSGYNPLAHNSRGTLVVPPDLNEKPYDSAPDVKGDLTKKECLIYNFEDHSLRLLLLGHHSFNRIAWLGKSQDYTRVLIVRDPFNMLASKLRWARGEKHAPSTNTLFTTRDLWKAYAKLYLRMVDIQSNTVCIDYNSWFSREDQRASYAKELGLGTHNKGINRVARYGPTRWGDSFDGLTYDGAAQEMQTLSRWKAFKSDELYLKLVRDRELIDLSRKIYSGCPQIDEACEYVSCV
jgi:hypothetical protein